MRRVLLPLLPIPVLALLVGLSCTRTRSEEPATHVIPPATPYAEEAARNAAATPPRAPADEPPTPAELSAFERRVAK